MRTKSTATDYFQFGFRSVGIWNVELDVPTQRFIYGSADVTDSLSRDLKATFPGFDVERANLAARERAGREQHNTGGDTSVVGNFVRGVVNDAARVAHAARDVFGLGQPNVETVEGSPPPESKPFRTLVIVGGVVLFVFVAWQVGLFALAKKKLTA